MNLLLTIRTALANLRANKLRTALTMLGIIIGVSTVIVMVSIVEGARSTVVQEFRRLGSDLIIIVYQPDRNEREKETRRLEGLTMDDVSAIKEQCALLGSVSAEMPLGNDTIARHRDREMDATPVGIQQTYTRIRNFQVARGRTIDAGDLQDWKKVCLIGEEVRRQLFGAAEDPLGQEIDLGGVTLTVVGVLAKKGRSAGGDRQDDKMVLLPITTLQKRYLGRDLVGVIFAQPRLANQLDAALDQVWQCLMRRHANMPGFRVDSQENLLSTIGRVLNIFGLVVGSIAGMALLVGGIGVMNIMLVSVTERTREIGIRKAVGAKRRDILWQFLIESATVTALGGLVGIGVGAGVSWVVGVVSAQVMKGGINGQPGIAVHLPVWAAVTAFLFSAFIGIFFGIYPAMRAASLAPIEALRYE